MKIQINIKKLLILSLAFILSTAIGTISHEYGHIIVAKILGYETELHYASMNSHKADLNDNLVKIYTENKTAILEGREFKQKEEYESGIDEMVFNGLLITIGGPLQTILTGFTGLTIIFWRRKKIKENGLRLVDWFAVFLSLFWLREVFNVVMSVGSGIISRNESYFGGDENLISEILNLWPGTISVLLGVIGLVISLFIIFRIVPDSIRLTFIFGGLIGGIIGLVLWMDILGPILLP
jgi:ABC-type dipeptide/oligopeptide/nickel transport system permease component